MDNQQLYQFDNEQLQVLYTARLGDGCLATSNSNSTYYVTNCKYKEYLLFKKSLLKDLFKNLSYREENGYCHTPIYILRSRSLTNELNIIKELDLSTVLKSLNELGIALWFYDDGSLHKNKHFYNLNTQKFSKEIQEEYFIPFFNKFNIFPKITKETKKDGRVFWYLRIGKLSGAYEITKILEKYPINCYNYKRWSSETIQKWSKTQGSLKS